MFSKDNLLASLWVKVPPGMYTQMKTQTGLRIRAVWSESSLSAWRNVASLAIKNAPSENSDQTPRMRRLISFVAGRTCPKVQFLR